MGKEHKNIDFEELVGKYLAGSALPDEVESLESIVKSDEQKKKKFFEIKKSWSLAKSSRYKFDTKTAWQKVEKETVRPDEKVKPLYPSISYGKKLLAVAATILLLIVGGYLIFNFIQYREKTIVAELEPTQHVLSDGTIVSLNVNSTLKYPAKFKRNERRVKLEGEAFFEVEAIDDKTFIVEARGVEIHVLGTCFNVNACKDKDIVEVTVYSGKVLMITPDGRQFELKAGEHKIFDKIEKIVFEEEVIDPNIISWKTRLLIFENTDLNYVFEVICNTYHIDIVIKDRELEGCRLTATFDDRPLEDILEIIKETFDLRYFHSDEKILVTGKDCE